MPLDPISIGIGAASLLIAVVPLVGQLITYARRRSQYEALQETFATQSKSLDKLSQESQEDKRGWNRILTLLEISDVIMPHVVQRFWRRFALLLAVAISSAAVSGATFTWKNGVTRADVFAGLLMLANWALPFTTFLRTNLFTSDERKFLANVGRLHDMFYEYAVIDVIHKFNRQCDDSLRMTIHAKESEKEFKELGRMFTLTLDALPQLTAARAQSVPGGPTEASAAAGTGRKDDDQKKR